MQESIYDLFNKVKQHPDFVAGTIFTVHDFTTEEELKAIDPDDMRDRMAEAGNQYVEDFVYGEGAC